MGDQEALGKFQGARQVARHEARGAGGDHDVARRVPADRREGALLELELLRDVLLDEVDRARHEAEIGGEGQLALGGQRRKGQARQGSFGVGDGAANPRLHLGLDVRGHHVDAEVQCARRPAAADHAGAEQSQSSHLSHDREYHPAPAVATRSF
jgi:hypothetical protein